MSQMLNAVTTKMLIMAKRCEDRASDMFQMDA